jgi:hypothetical protein
MFSEIESDPPRAPLPESQIFNDAVDIDPDAAGAPDEYNSLVRGMIDDAREFNAEVLYPIRLKGIRLYLGLEPDLDDEGRSTIVATEVKDTILQMLPSLMRLFTAQDPTTTFQPTSKATVDIAEQQTEYLQHVLFSDNPGYMILQDVFKDAMIKAMGAVQWWTDDNLEILEQDYARLTLEQRQYLISQPGVEVVNQKTYSRPGPDGVSVQPAFDLTIRRSNRSPMHKVAAVPPDEVRINRRATCVKDAALIGRDRLMTQSDLIRKGIPRALVAAYADRVGEDMYFADERMYRNQGQDSPQVRDIGEPRARYGEYWIRIDKDDDGIAELRHICTLGDNHFIVMDEPAVRPKMAIACTDPEPHSIVGHGVAELAADLQVIKTNLLRGSLDSLAQAIYPRMMGVETLVDWDDVLNTAIGAPIRLKDIGALQQLQYAFVGQPAFDMMDRLDAIRMARTGITEQSKGLDPKALQSTTLKGIEMVITGAQERIELVARTMAHTFMVDLMTGLLNEVTEHPVPERVVKLRGKFVPVQIDQFDANMSCIPNPAMGRGSDLDRWTLLGQVKATQEQIIAQMGPANPFVTPEEYHNTLEDILGIGGLKNVDRYFKSVDPATLQAFMTSISQKEDPNLVLAKAEADKVRAQIVKTLADARVKTEDLTLADDRERDKFQVDQLLKAAEIDAKYGAAIDTAAMAALWSAPRTAPNPAGPTASGEGGAAPLPPGAEPAPAAGPGPVPGPRPELPTRSAIGPHPPRLMERPSAPPGLLSPA